MNTFEHAHIQTKRKEDRQTDEKAMCIFLSARFLMNINYVMQRKQKYDNLSNVTRISFRCRRRRCRFILLLQN